MANPNIVNVTTIYGNTTYFTPTATTAVVLLNNPAGSNKVFKINQIVASNVTASVCNATVSVYTNGAVAQGSAPAGGTGYPVVYQVSVPGNASLICVDKSTAIYLQEDTSITVVSAIGSSLTYSISYEDIS